MKPCNQPLLAACCEGFAGLPNPHLRSSNMEEIHRIGSVMREQGMQCPSHVHKSRGSTYLVNGKKFAIEYGQGGSFVKFN